MYPIPFFIRNLNLLNIKYMEIESFPQNHLNLRAGFCFYHYKTHDQISVWLELVNLSTLRSTDTFLFLYLSCANPLSLFLSIYYSLFLYYLTIITIVWTVTLRALSLALYLLLFISLFQIFHPSLFEYSVFANWPFNDVVKRYYLTIITIGCYFAG